MVSSIKNKAPIIDNRPRRSFWGKLMHQLSRIGKSLFFPISVLPLAAIFVRIGYAIPDTTAFSHFIKSIILTTGNSVFSTIPIIFAIGIGFGMTNDSRGEAALCAFVAMSLMTILLSSSGYFGGVDIVNQIYGGIDLGSGHKGFHYIFGKNYDAILAKNVLNGIVIGGFTAFIYNRFNNIDMPQILGFFSGRRLVPVLVIGFSTIFTLIWALVWPWLGYALNELSISISKASGSRYSNAAIMFAYGILNRLLLPFGMHHIPNTLFWFQLGNFTTETGQIVHGDINGFLSGVSQGNTAGIFQSGFFTIMMFGLPALVGAIWFMAEKSQRNKVIGLLGGAAIVSFFTGITEPIEFSFLFVAPILFGLHVFLTGFFGFIVGLFGIQLGFGFSAGLIDYLLSIPKSLDIIAANKTGISATFANPLWIIPIGLITGLVYFFGSVILIKKFNISTPGRGNNLLGIEKVKLKKGKSLINNERAQKYLLALGGYNNITKFENCATRLRYDVKDMKLVDQKKLKDAGAFGVLKISNNHLQIVVGPNAEIINEEIKNAKSKQ